ncbi:hypothetical protein BgiMline_007411 [Biomphalaria glabrata]|nr:hypothetical protein BgiMline_022978 [Biomphalaria glabrata]
MAHSAGSKNDRIAERLKVLPLLALQVPGIISPSKDYASGPSVDSTSIGPQLADAFFQRCRIGQLGSSVHIIVIVVRMASVVGVVIAIRVVHMVRVVSVICVVSVTCVVSVALVMYGQNNLCGPYGQCGQCDLCDQCSQYGQWDLCGCFSPACVDLLY